MHGFRWEPRLLGWLWRWHHDGHLHLAGAAHHGDPGRLASARPGLVRDPDIGNPRRLRVTCTPVLDDEVGEWLAEVWPQPPAEATPGQVAQAAEADLNLPAPTVSTAPSGGKAIVGLESWLWIDPTQWQPITATAAVNGITATATATPVSVVWAMGDGNQVTCNGPGVAYNTNIPDADETTNCGYTYQETSASGPNQQFTITTAIEYDVTWTSVGVAGGGELGDILGASTSTAVTVDEIGTVTVPNP